MKKVLCSALVLGLTVSSAIAAPRQVTRPAHLYRAPTPAGYTVNYDYYDKEKSGWYAAIRAQLNFLNWTNEYDTDWPHTNDEFNKDKYSFESLFGGSVSVGKRFSYFWRGEVEVGYTGNFTDADSGFEFNFSTPYALFNIMYDFNGGDDGVYIGGGLGLAMPMTTLDWDGFIADGRSQTSISPMAGVMVGYGRQLDDNFVLDFRYRLSGWMGDTYTRNFEDTDDNKYYLNVDIGLVLENQLSLALRYEF